MVAIPMMWYNYARFGSVTDFGASYQLTLVDVTDLSQRYKDIPKGLYEYLISPYTFQKEFPYITNNISLDGHTENYMNGGMVAGIVYLNLSVFICIFWFKAYKKAQSTLLKQLMIFLPIVGFIMSIVVIVLGASIQRYVVDYFWMFSYLAMIIWFIIYKSSNKKQKKLLFNIAFFLILFSVMLNIYGTFFNSELDCYMYFYG